MTRATSSTLCGSAVTALSLCDLFRIPDFVDLGTALAAADDLPEPESVVAHPEEL